METPGEQLNAAFATLKNSDYEKLNRAHNHLANLREGREKSPQEGGSPLSAETLAVQGLIEALTTQDQSEALQALDQLKNEIQDLFSRLDRELSTQKTQHTGRDFEQFSTYAYVLERTIESPHADVQLKACTLMGEMIEKTYQLPEAPTYREQGNYYVIKKQAVRNSCVNRLGNMAVQARPGKRNEIHAVVVESLKKVIAQDTAQNLNEKGEYEESYTYKPESHTLAYKARDAALKGLRNLFKTIGVAQASRQEIKTICEQYEPEKPMNITNPLEGLQSLPEVANEFNRLYEELKANAPDYTQAYLDTLLAGKKGKTWDYARPTAFSDLQPCPLVDPVLKYGAQLKVGCVWNLYYWRMVSNYSFEEIKEGDTVKGLRLHRQGAGYGDYLLLKDGRILHSGPAMTVGTDGKGVDRTRHSCRTGF